MKTDTFVYRGTAFSIYNRLSEMLAGVNTVIYAMGFLLGRASLPGGLLPIAISLFFALSGKTIRKLPFAAVVIAGTLTTGNMNAVFLSAASMILFSVMIALQKGQKTVIKVTAVGFAAIMMPSLVYVASNGFLAFDFLRIFLSGGMAALLTVVFSSAISGFEKSGNKEPVLSNEEIIGVSIVFLLSLTGIPEIHAWGMNLKSTVCFLTILFFGYKYGPGIGAAGGVVVGITLSISSGLEVSMAGAYAFCGLLAGIFSKLGKAGSLLGFMLANAVLALYISSTQNILMYIREILTAGAAFLIIPERLLGFNGVALESGAPNWAEERHDRHMTSVAIDRLNKFSTAFKELSHAFDDAAKPFDAENQSELVALFDRTADKVCRTCAKTGRCWGNNFLGTYQAFFGIASGEEGLKFPCDKLSELTFEINSSYNLLKSDVKWKNRIGESRVVVSKQLESLSKVISGLADEIEFGQGFRNDIEKDLKEELALSKVHTREVLVLEKSNGRNEVVVVPSRCGKEKNCEGKIQNIVSSVMGKNMVRIHSGCEKNQGNGACRLTMIEEPQYRGITGVSKVSKYGFNVSGDCYTFLKANDGKYIIALSDGMGCGEEALKQSKAAIELLESFFESGFDSETTIDIINSALLMNSGDDSFATLDLCILDLYDGQAEFAKVGAAPGFVKRQHKVETVKLASIPAGILGEIEIETSRKTLSNGDVVVMMTDGIFDALKLGLAGEGKNIASFLNEIKNTNPQETADIILGKACDICGGQPFDDMTVVVTEVMQRLLK